MRAIFRPEQQALLLFFGVAVGALVFLFLTRIALGEAPHAFDEAILHFFRADAETPLGPSRLREAMTEWTTLGGWPFLVLLTIFGAVYMMLRGHWRHASILVAAVVGQSILVNLLKELFGRERPAVVDHLVEATSYSFPSGHSASAAAVYLTLAAILTREVRRRREKLFIIAVAVFLVVLIGVTRVYLGVHYPSDVLAGWSFGAAWASLVLLIARFLERPAETR